MMQKYFKPRSVTWWCAVIPLIAGVVVATEPLHGLTGVVQVINNVTGGVAPAVLINAGLGGIGLRGAM